MSEEQIDGADHVHYWILDRNSFGRCCIKGCNATKQFPVEEITPLTETQRKFIEGFKLISNTTVASSYLPESFRR